MLISVKARPDGWENKVEKLSEARFLVETKESPRAGRANRAIAALLAGYLNLPVGKIKLIKGGRESNKIFKIDL